MKFLWFCFLVTLGPFSKAMDLGMFLEEVNRKHGGLAADRQGEVLAESRRLAGDLELVPSLNFRTNYISDKKQPNFYGATETQNTQHSLLLNKKFSTGTMVQLGASVNGSENLNMPANPSLDAYKKYSQGTMSISFSQSLWKDAFGRGTKLRRERESWLFQAEKSLSNLQMQQTLIEAENIYWDYLYLQEELKLRRASLERALRLEYWMKRRTASGISQQSDLLNAQSLVAVRRLQLLNSEDEWTNVIRRLRDFLELAPGESAPELTGSLNQVRPPRSPQSPSGHMVRLDAWMELSNAKAKKTMASAVEDSMRADLLLTGSYATNNYQAGGSALDGTKGLNDRDKPTTQVGLSWTYLFDTEVKSSVNKSAMLDSQIAEMKSRRKLLDSKSAWLELIRRHEELSKKVDAAVSIASLQLARAKAEQDLFSKGRTITANVINSEQEAAESELSLVRLKAEQRKLEAQVRQYILVGESQL